MGAVVLEVKLTAGALLFNAALVKIVWGRMGSTYISKFVVLVEEGGALCVFKYRLCKAEKRGVLMVVVVMMIDLPCCW